MYSTLSPLLTGKIKPKHIIGFDVETHSDKNEFLMGTTYTESEQKTFYTREKMQEYLLSQPDNTYIVASNLQFDFSVLFYNSKYFFKFQQIINGSQLVSAIYETDNIQKKYVDIDGKQVLYGRKTIYFIDTYNYIQGSVAYYGKVLGIPKLEKPSTLSEIPQTPEEWKELETYCMRDSEITYKFTMFLQENYNIIGSNMKLTSSSTSMDLFKRKYLKRDIKSEEKKFSNVNKKIFSAYYGGRTEIFKRGYYKNMKYYDFNCFSEDTELLTTNGFKKYSEINENTVCYGMKNDRLRKQSVRKLFMYNIDDELIRLTNENTDMMVTKNHRVYYKDYIRSKQSKEKYKTWTEWKIKKAIDIPQTYIKFPNAKLYNGHYRPNIFILRLCAWYITEGSISKSGMIEISQSLTINEYKCKILERLLEDCNIKYRRTIRIQKGKKYLYIHFRKEYIEKYFTNISSLNSYNMRLINRFQDLSYDCKRIFFNELMLGDGSRQKGKTTYVSYSNELLDDIQILCTMIELKCSINYKNHVANIKIHRDGNSQIDKKEIIKYKGKVWCVNTPLQNVVVRRNGKIFISGNSLYPSCMLNEYPDPDTVKYVSFPTSKVFEYEGVSEVMLEIEEMDYPILPVMHKKLIFPTGKIRGTYTHLEIRKAIDEGYSVKKIFWSVYYKKTFFPFKAFVEDMYSKRMNYKEQKNPTELVFKLLMNSLYGKFAQKNMSEIKFIDYENLEEKERIFTEYPEHEGILYIRNQDNKGYLVKKNICQSSFVRPIFSVYTTAYGRVKLWDVLNKYDGAYCDTDSIVTKKEVNNSMKLGALKLETEIRKGIFVKPKCYTYTSKDGKEVTRLKGIPKADTKVFERILEHKSVEYMKFTKMKESIKRNFIPNQKILMSKKMGLEDDKRVWNMMFTPYFYDEYSRPYKVVM